MRTPKTAAGWGSGNSVKRVRERFGRFVVAMAAAVAVFAGVAGAGEGTAVAVPLITVSPSTLAVPLAGVPYTPTTFTATGGVAPYVFAVTAGAVPPGMTFTDGVLAGTPTMLGPANFTVTATDADGATGSSAYFLVVSVPSLTITPATLPYPQVGVAYAQDLTASGSVGPYLFTVAGGSLPSGLTLSTTGTISGTPTSTTPSAFTVSAMDRLGYTALQTYTLGAQPPALTLEPSLITGLAVDTPFSLTLTGGGGTAPFTYFLYDATALPAGLSLTPGGALSGTPTQAGGFTFLIAARDSTTGTGAPFTVVRSYTVTVATAPAPTLTAVSPARAVAGETVRLSGTDLLGATAVTLGGVALDTFTVVDRTTIDAVVPQLAPGDASFTVTTAGGTTVQPLAFTILAPLAVDGGALPSAIAGSGYAQALTATGGAAPYSYAVSAGSTLPGGLTLSASGAITGTPATAGTASFDTTVTDADGRTATATITLRTYSSTVQAPATVSAGGTIALAGTGFEPGDYALVLHSDPVSLGTVTVGQDGVLSHSATIPASTPAGAHELVLSLDGVVVSTTPITVTAASAPAVSAPTPTATAGASTFAAATGLASTGSGAPLWPGALAATLLLAGAALVGVRRTRRA
jgi:large repetitive protein